MITTKIKRIPWNKGKTGLQVPWNKGLGGITIICKQCNKKRKVQSKGKNRAYKFCSVVCRFKNSKGKPTFIKYTSEVRKKISVANTGKNNPNWIIDRKLVQEKYQKRNSTESRQWSKGIKKRDGFNCKIFNKNCTTKLQAHHILNWEDYPSLRYDINNGITLCTKHHPRGRENERKAMSYLKTLI